VLCFTKQNGRNYRRKVPAERVRSRAVPGMPCSAGARLSMGVCAAGGCSVTTRSCSMGLAVGPKGPRACLSEAERNELSLWKRLFKSSLGDVFQGSCTSHGALGWSGWVSWCLDRRAVGGVQHPAPSEPAEETALCPVSRTANCSI